MPPTHRNPALAAAFGQVVRELRIEKGVAQEALALIAETDRSYFGRIERGEKQPSLDIVFRIATALGVRAEELVARTSRVADQTKTRRRNKAG